MRSDTSKIRKKKQNYHPIWSYALTAIFSFDATVKFIFAVVSESVIRGLAVCIVSVK